MTSIINAWIFYSHGFYINLFFIRDKDQLGEDLMYKEMVIYDKENTFKDTVLNINEQFIKEAQDSPSLFSDMASMESYMAESYNERVFAELLQNADDSHSTKIYVEEHNNNLYVANNGRPFNNSDLMALCRSGSSNKRRGDTIGYRGIGFKSSTRISQDIEIWSNNTFFSFSKKRCAIELQIPIEDIPTVRIPFLVENVTDDVFNKVTRLKEAGYKTIFVFRNANLNEFISEVREIESGYFIFLNNVLECKIILPNIKNEFLIERKIENSKGTVTITDNSMMTDRWVVFQGGNSSFAFKSLDGKISPSSSAEATYHCYLPSNDSAPFSFKINGDFSTDPSRKNIMMDEYTKNVLIDIVNELKIIINSIFMGRAPEYASQMLLILNEQKSFSRINTYFKEIFSREISQLSLVLSSGNEILIKDYKVLPSWLENSEKDFLRENNQHVINQSLPYSIYNKFDGIDEFISTYSSVEYSFNDFYKVLAGQYDLLEKAPHIYNRLYANILKAEKMQQQIYAKKPLYTSKLYNEISDKINVDTSQSLEEYLTTSDKKWLYEVTGYDLRKEDEPRTAISESPGELFTNRKPVVTKWRSTEKQVIEIEEHLGNKAIDVSKRNVGYDIESVTPEGEYRYIEVKSLNGENSTFSITNNEYTSAHQLGNSYYICLVFNGKAIYIQNPISNLEFEKRIRQWEWYCEDYTGVEIEIEEK